jgi:hypothetical protein
VTLEAERGCGYRKPGGLYLMSGGPGVVCDRLPAPITPCACCGFEPGQNRALAWVPGRWLGEHRTQRVRKVRLEWPGRFVVEREFRPCPDHGREHVALNGAILLGRDPVCEPSDERELLGWVGAKFYSPDSFNAEAAQLGVSKRIAELPSGLELGKTWVLLAHPEACFEPVSWAFRWLLGDGEVGRAPGVIHGFIPTRVELVLHESLATPERVEKERARGVEVVIVPDGATDARVSWRPGEPRPAEAGPTREQRADAECDESFDRPELPLGSGTPISDPENPRGVAHDPEDP